MYFSYLLLKQNIKLRKEVETKSKLLPKQPS